MHNRHGKGVPEKSKDFNGAMKKLIIHIKPWHFLLILSLTLAMISAIMSLIAPNKLKDITNEITKGLIPNITEENISNIMSNPDISNEDKMKFTEVLESSKNMNKDDSNAQNNFYVKLDELPKPIYEIIKPTMDMSIIKSITIFLIILYLISALFGYIQ